MNRNQPDYGEQMAEAASGGFDSIEDMRADERRERQARRQLIAEFVISSLSSSRIHRPAPVAAIPDNPAVKVAD